MENKKFTIDRVDLEGLTDKQLELVKKLNVSLYRNDLKDYKGLLSDSIMHYGQFCRCDDAFLCEHRLQFIIDYLKNK